ncbi:MAG: YncE family protein, partial [Acidobacteriota bacterium]|nr:YncE family protein [Acidobacteriota bacterium]
GQLTTRADADLNSYLIATLNHDRTVTFLNPSVTSISRMESAVELKANGFDWVYAPALGRIFITMPEASAVAVIDSVTEKFVADIALEKSSKPGRLALAPDGRSVWVSLDGASKAAVIDGSNLSVRGYAPAGRGIHAIAFSPDGKRVWIANSQANSVSVIDAGSLASIATVAVDSTPVTIVWMPAAAMVYVASLNGETISAIHPDTNQVAARISAGRGVTALGVDPEGRFLIAVNQLQSRITSIDTATNRVVTTVAVELEPDQIVFTNRFAYVRSLDSDKFTLIELKDLRSGTAKALTIQGGRHKPSEEAGQVTGAAMIAPTPEGNSVLVANAPDAVLYFYEEGLMAPKGTFDNYRRKPRGVLIVDRSLQQMGKGVFSGPVRVAASGRFDVPVVIDQPKLHMCFEASLEGSATQALASTRLLRLVAIDEPKNVAERERIHVKFRIEDARSGAPASGFRAVQMLAFQPPGQWQDRQWLKESGDGIYEGWQAFPHAGRYVLQVNVLEPGVRLDSHPLYIRADVSTAPATAGQP